MPGRVSVRVMLFVVWHTNVLLIISQIGFKKLVLTVRRELTKNFHFPLTNHRSQCTVIRMKAGIKEILMIVVTTDTISHYRIVETKGQVFGVVVRSRGLGGNVMAGLRSLAGGEITEYTQMLEDARRHAIDRMVQNATMMGANAIVRMQFDSSEIGNVMSEVVAYGTAVVIEPEG